MKVKVPLDENNANFSGFAVNNLIQRHFQYDNNWNSLGASSHITYHEIQPSQIQTIKPYLNISLPDSFTRCVTHIGDMHIHKKLNLKKSSLHSNIQTQHALSHSTI